jgi:hypothetical protein
VTSMSRMFLGASNFNQHLCSWREPLESSGANVIFMFFDTNCPVVDTPDLSDPTGSFCVATCP